MRSPKLEKHTNLQAVSVARPSNDNQEKSSLVIVYHRQPYDEVVENGKVRLIEKSKPNGIVPTLKGFFSEVPRGTWVAWKSCEPGQEEDFESSIDIENESGRLNVRRIPLTPDEVNSFYHVTSKEAFWPVLHTFPSLFSNSSSDWEVFDRINRAFAEAVCEEAEDDATVWVHDYNLWRVPWYLRRAKPNLKIGFFHHTPFPAPDVFNLLPWREQIIDSLLACDLVGFHIPRYAENFTATARSLRKITESRREPVPEGFVSVGNALAEPMMTREIRYAGRRVHVDVFPVGASTERIGEILESEESQERVAAIRQALRDPETGEERTLILASSRVDFTKGSRELLLAYERLLERRPELHGQVVLMLIAVSAAEGMKVYDEVQADIEQLVGRINGQYSSIDWQPVVLTTNSIPYEEVVEYYKAADICWITPLRDGLNLVAKEYVAAHGGEGDGVLILSEFAGAAVELSEALQVNPWCSEEMDRGIDRALSMPRTERARRMKAMYREVCRSDISFWSEQVSTYFSEPEEPSSKSSARPSALTSRAS